MSSTAADPIPGPVTGPPSSNTGVVNPTGTDPYGWDWSQTTHRVPLVSHRPGPGELGPCGPASEPGPGSSYALAKELLQVIGGAAHVPGKGLQGWKDSIQVFDRDGFKVAQVYYGGGRNDVHVVSTSGPADDMRVKVRGVAEAVTSRVDTRVDTLVPWDDLVAVMRDAAGRKAKLTFVSSEADGESLGRTLYVGSPTSQVRIRLYEKWLESPGQYVDGTNRVEVQLRPPSRAKGAVSGWSRAETFCASELSRRVARELGTEFAQPGSMQVSRGEPDLERALRHMSTQYGPSVKNWLKASGGDIGRVLDLLT